MSQCIHRIFTVNANSSHFAHCDRCNSHAVGASLRPFSAPCSHLRTERKRDSNQYDPFYSSCRSSLSLSSAGAVFLCRFARHELRSVFQGGSRYVLGGGGHSPELELELIQTQMAQKPMLRAEVGMRVRCANKASAE